MKNNRSILMITPFFSPNIGGVETHLDDLVDYLDEDGFKVTVITYKPLTTKVKAPFKEKIGTQAIVRRYPWPAFNLFYALNKFYPLQFLYLFSGLFIYSTYYSLTNLTRIKVVHGHGLSSAAVTVLLAKLLRKRSVVSLHTIYKFSQRKFLGRIAGSFLKKTDHILVLSDKCKEDLCAIGISEDKITRYTNWLELDLFKPMNKFEARERLSLDRSKPLALFVGRLTPEKRIDVVLEAAALTNDNINFAIVGAGPLGSKVSDFAKKNNNIINIGAVKAKHLPTYFSAADILVMAPVDEDYLGRVSLAALACGCPIIVSKTSNYFGIEKEISLDFPEGVIGFKVDPKPVKVAEKINKLFIGRNNISEMAKECRSYAENNFSNRNAQVITNTYRKLIER